MPGLTTSNGDNDTGRRNIQHLAKLKSDLEDCFTSQLASGTAAYHARYLQYPNPALEVEGAGGIGLPLSDTTALKTIATPTTRAAPTDLNCTTWEVDASRVTFLNPLFQEWITGNILPDCLQELGIEDLSREAICADLYKLILYGPSAANYHYPAPTGSDHTVGFLMVCLSSSHEGGEILFRHEGAVRTWQTSHESSFSLSYAAWYADVEQIQVPIREGHRLALLYRLHDSTQRATTQRAAHLSQASQRLQDILQSWRESMDLSYLCYSLDFGHKGRVAKLSSLAGSDRQLVKRTCHIAERAKFSVYLSTLEYREAGLSFGMDEFDEFHEMNDVDERSWSLSAMRDMQGKEVIINLKTCGVNLIGEDEFGDSTPDREEFEKDGISGSCIQYHTKTVMILIPNERIPVLKLGPELREGRDVTLYLQELAERFLATPHDDICRAQLAAACGIVEETLLCQKHSRTSRSGGTGRSKRVNEEVPPYAARCAAYLGDEILFENILMRASQMPDTEKFEEL